MIGPTFRPFHFAVAVALALATTTVAQEGGQERFSAFAVSTGGPNSGSVAQQVMFGIDHWTTAEQRQSLSDALKEKGADGLLEQLRRLPEAGFIRTPDSIGYPLRYADQQALPNGRRRIVLATDRPIAFWETWESARTLDYPFTVIELQVDQEGHGEGKLSLATKVVPLDGRILLENWQVAPVHLTNVRADR
jgi:hypothetical protein